MQVTARDIDDIVQDFGPVFMKLGKTNFFSGEESGKPHDVVYVEVFSSDIRRLNRIIADHFPHEKTQKTYIPHITLAYVKKGKGKKYAGNNAVEGMTLMFYSLLFSDKNREKEEISLTTEIDGKQHKRRDMSEQPRDELGRWTELSQFSWSEQEHPRGKPENAGQFSEKPGSGSKSAHESVEKMIRPHVTDTPQFKAWFGDSKIVGKSGKPMVVYHGNGRDFDQFSPKTIGQGDPGFHGEGFYFSESPQVASDYAPSRDGGNVKPVYLSIKNPFLAPTRHTHGEDSWRDAYRSELSRIGVTDFDDRKHQSEKLMAAGYDGVIVRVKDESGNLIAREIVAFHPHQIKSAIGNRGSFSPEDPRINMSQISRFSITAADLDEADQFGQLKFDWGDDDEAKHPRGQPGNPGQFAKKGGGTKTAPKPSTPKPESKPEPKPASNLPVERPIPTPPRSQSKPPEIKKPAETPPSQPPVPPALPAKPKFETTEEEDKKYEEYLGLMKQHKMTPRDKEDWVNNFRSVQKNSGQTPGASKPPESVKPAEPVKPAESPKPSAAPTPPAKPKFVPKLTDDQWKVVDKIEEIISGRHPARGRMVPSEILHSVLAGTSTAALKEIIDSKAISPQQESAIGMILFRRELEAKRVKILPANPPDSPQSPKKSDAPTSQPPPLPKQETKMPSMTFTEITGHGPTVKEINLSLSTIGSVHRAPANIRPIPVKTNSGTSTLGKFMRIGTYADSIEVSKNGSHRRTTFAHEFGHRIDNHFGSHKGTGFCSDAANRGEGPMVGLMTTIAKSQGVAKLDEMRRAKGGIYEAKVTRGGKEVTVRFPIDYGHLRYLMSPVELFARAYAQYISHRGSDSLMKVEVGVLAKSSYPTQWDDEDFEPIAVEFDKFFENQGLREPKGKK